jgi:hypothetical protein
MSLLPNAQTPLTDFAQIDLTQIDPTWAISRHFSFREALYLPSWARMAGSSDGLTVDVLVRVAWFLRNGMDPVRDDYGEILAHCCLRPPAYNRLPEVAGAPNSAHQALVDHLGVPLQPTDMVAAMDFNVVGFEGGTGCDQIRAKLAPELSTRGLRMERRPGSAWIHLDCAPVISNAYFLP